MQMQSIIERLRAALGTRRGWATVGKAVLLIVVGFLAAWLLIPSGQRDRARDDAHRHANAHDDQAGQMWTCSMHPQIQRPGPGSCPICGMDLIPVGRSGAALTGLRQLELSPAARELMNIQVRPVERRFVSVQVRMVGKVEYDETRLRRITAWIPGRLDRLYVDYTGVQVRRGDHMAYIYSPELYTAQQELIQAVRSAREREPGRRLLGGIDLVESSREKLRLLGLTDEQVRQIERQDRPSSHLTIYAPIGGIVIDKLKQEGDYVQTGERIYTVADLSQVWVQLDAYESDLVWLRYGQEVTFSTEAYPGEKFIGRIAFIDPILDDRTRTVKVRVNVVNPERKLKPSMFVRGIAEAEIAGGGRVIDAELAGKWISPMHPEIVKDEPGQCDICGMPLVRAESLGYVSTEDLLTEPPLVIPASAVLWTGTRAVVYVEVPETEQPTYEGREIVLGPRAGDDYLVRGGLGEGELVVARGNFKIDSALQIQARPSMMTPEGGGGGGHQHDHGASPAAAEQPAGETMVQAPPEFLAQLRNVESAFQEIRQAEEESNLGRVRQAFQRLGEAVDGVDAQLVRGHTDMVWKEFRMLLSNDAIEGRAAMDADTARRIARKTERTIERVRDQLMAPQGEHAGHAEHIAKRLEVPESFAAQLADVLQRYFTLQTALAGDDLAAARRAVGELRSATQRVSDRELSEAARQAWHREHNNLNKILDALAEQDELKTLRLTFSQLSGEMEGLVHRFGAGPAGPVYRVHCPMAFGNQGAWWLQQTEEIRNPYFGASMLKCHDRFEKIAGGPAGTPQEHTHE
jgi:membrane fusion protein, copper/silver efflux system